MPIIEAHELSKAFPIEFRREVSLRHEFSALMRRFVSRDQGQPDRFFALRDVSFTVERGEGFAIVGRNGAGKTTLLRLIADILAPTGGRVKVYGQYVAMLGLGPGFNAHLTGEENLYLGGAFMGIDSARMKTLMREIVEFSELGEFIHAPLKTYSSGMQARLGFSLVLHTLPEIILVDEVIAVGDAAFQKKCFARMQELISDGRTVVLVSHSEEPIRQLCQRAMWLEHGEVQCIGDVDAVLAAYQAYLNGQ